MALAALIASPNHKRALESQNATATPGAPIGNALHVASRVRSAYAALRYAPASTQGVTTANRGTPVARRNERARATSERGTHGGGASRLDSVTEPQTCPRNTKRHRHSRCPHRQRSRVASRVRSAYAALRYVAHIQPKALPRQIEPHQPQYVTTANRGTPVARRND